MHFETFCEKYNLNKDKRLESQVWNLLYDYCDIEKYEILKEFYSITGYEFSKCNSVLDKFQHLTALLKWILKKFDKKSFLPYRETLLCFFENKKSDISEKIPGKRFGFLEFYIFGFLD